MCLVLQLKFMIMWEERPNVSSLFPALEGTWLAEQRADLGLRTMSLSPMPGVEILKHDNKLKALVGLVPNEVAVSLNTDGGAWNSHGL